MTYHPDKRPNRRNCSQYWAHRRLVGIAASFLALWLPVAAAAQVPVTVTINRFIQGQDPDPAAVVDLGHDTPDLRGDGDYYARVRIGDHPFRNNRSDFIERSDFQPSLPSLWQFTEVVDQPGTIPVVIQIWDADLIENNDDIIDLNENDNAQELVLNLDLDTCNWDGDTGPQGVTSSGDGDHEHFGTLEGGERGHVFFDLACSDGDFDDDGIPDAVERFGIFDFTDNGWEQVEDMRTRGADPCRKTILVELDAVQGAVPAAGAEIQLRDAFDAAPIAAPIADCPYPDFAPAQAGIDFVLDFSHLQLPPTAIDGNGNFQLGAVDFYKATAFNSWRERYFHYALWVPSAAPTPGRCCAGARGTDFIGQPQGSARADAALLMHELGHALGLRHSGQDNIDADANASPVSRNCKPNYQSLMNYIFPTGILDTATGDFVLDYSREVLPTLDESALTEQVALDDGTLQVCWSPFLGTTSCGPANAPINWNGSTTGGIVGGGLDTFDPGTVSVDVNAFAIRECGRQWQDQNSDGLIQAAELLPLSTPGDILRGSDDWGNLEFRAPFANPTGAGPIDIVELTEDEILGIEVGLQARLRCNPPETGAWQVNRDCTIWRDVAAPGDLRISAGVVLTVATNVELKVDLAEHALRIDPGGRLIVSPGARVD